MDQVFSKENKRLKEILENWKKNTGKVREKSGNFVSPEKWELCINIIVHINYFVLNKFDTDITCDCYTIQSDILCPK